MGVVAAEIDIQADPVRVFEIACKVETFPDFMPDVKKVELIERRNDGFARTSWIGTAKVATINKEIKWIEDAWWDRDSLTSQFEQVKGDYKHYFGGWTFTPVGTGTHVKLTVDYDLGLPLIGPLIVKLLDKLMQDNINSMLKAIKDRAESN
jgi:ribosome-associated toxin RatA of RatAB toxin-antitoxin module